MDKLLSAVRELEALFESNALDIEFAQAEDGILYILQVLTLVLREPGKDLARQGEVLKRIYDYLKRADGPKPHLFGRKALYSVMTDWNPAEIIGIRPKPLALSLYKNLITDGTWAYQRADYGYKDLRSFVSTDIFTEEEYNAYIAGLNTVGSGISADFDELTKNAFLKKYGHLRPGVF